MCEALRVWLSATALLTFAACGGPGRVQGGGPGTRGTIAAQAVPVAHPAPTTTLRVHGARAVALPRAVEGAVYVALFVDAGWRDATPPQLATVAASVAAARQPGVRARVEPDLTEWSVVCTRVRLDACVAQLASVLALRGTTDTEALAARREMIDARRVALADEGRTADGLAFAAMWALPHAGAFGEVDDDALDGGAITRFASAHYGPSRALVVAAGDVDESALQSALSRALAAAPEATATRREGTTTRRNDRAAVRVRVGETDVVSVALRVPDASLARAIAARAEAENTNENMELSAVPLRDGGAVLARCTGVRRDVDTLAREAADAFARIDTARREVTRASRAETPDALDALARTYGRAFATGDVWPASAHADVAADGLGTTGYVGIGVVVRGARHRPVRGTDPDVALARETETRIRTAIEQARRALDGAEDASTARGTLANGARLGVQRTPGATTHALAVRFAVDHGAEPAALLGRAALTAEALGVACRESASRGGVTLSPRTTRGSFGLLATGPSDDALMVLLRCALHASPDEAEVDEARRRRIDALSPIAAPEQHARILAARALTPSTPALLAPEGSADGIAAVPDAEVRALLDDARRGARVHVMWAGDGEPPLAALARRLATLEAGTPGADTAPGGASVDEVMAAPWRGPGLRATVALRAAAPLASTSPQAAEQTARAFARVLAARLGEAPGLRVVAADGAAPGADVVTAWVSLDLDEAALEALPATLRIRLTALADARVGRDAIADAYTRDEATLAAALAVPAVVADRGVLALAPMRETRVTPISHQPLAEVVDALAAAPWRVVVARPVRAAR